MWRVVAVLVILLLGSNLAWMGAYIRQHEEHVQNLWDIIDGQREAVEAAEEMKRQVHSIIEKFKGGDA